jgi:hypothetical protein
MAARTFPELMPTLEAGERTWTKGDPVRIVGMRGKGSFMWAHQEAGGAWVATVWWDGRQARCVAAERLVPGK